MQYEQLSQSTNSVCRVCNERFNTTLEDLLVCKVCHNVCHQRCWILGGDKVCHKLATPIHESDIKNYSPQKYIDICSLKRTNYIPSFTDYARGIFIRMPYLLWNFALLYCDYTYGNIFGTYSKTRYNKFLDAIACCLNINSKIIGIDKINPNNKVVYVSNHVCFYDALTIPRHINVGGAIASVSVMRHTTVKIFNKYTNVLFVKRGYASETKSIVDQINDFVNKHNNILICPEGLLGKYNIINKFRTSAFRTNYPVQPIIIKYKQDVSSINPLDILLFPRVDIEIYVLDPIVNTTLTPLEYAENTRASMARMCGLLLSNVDSRDIKD